MSTTAVVATAFSQDSLHLDHKNENGESADLNSNDLLPSAVESVVRKKCCKGCADSETKASELYESCCKGCADSETKDRELYESCCKELRKTYPSELFDIPFKPGGFSGCLIPKACPRGPTFNVFQFSDATIEYEFESWRKRYHKTDYSDPNERRYRTLVFKANRVLLQNKFIKEKMLIDYRFPYFGFGSYGDRTFEEMMRLWKEHGTRVF